MARTVPHFGLSGNDFSGELVIGTSPVMWATWAGRIRGLAVYDQELTPPQVSSHCKIWTQTGTMKTLEPGTMALYEFDERAGSVVHNRIIGGPDLEIPRSFEIPYEPLLQAPWNEFAFSRSYLRDAAVNLVGFMPFGFFFCAYYSSIWRNRRATLVTVVLGGLVSLGVEILQKYLPVRDSSMTDVITNTSGTALGAVLYQWKMVHSVLARCGLAIEP